MHRLSSDLEKTNGSITYPQSVYSTYEDSKFDEKETAGYASEAEYKADIQANGYKLNDFLKPEFFKTYEELSDTLAWYTNEKETKSETDNSGLTEATVAATVAPTVEATVAPTVAATVAPTVEATVAPTVTPTVAPTVEAPADDLDDILNELM